MKPQLVQLKEGNCFCDHVLHGDSQTPWGSSLSPIHFQFLSWNQASSPLPLLVELHATILLQPFSKKENWVWTQIDNWVFILNSSNPQEVVLYWFNARDALSFQVFLPNWTFLDKVLTATFLSCLNKERYSEHFLYLYVDLEWHWETQYQFEIVKSFLFVWICHALKERVKYSPDCSIFLILLHILHIPFSFFWWILCCCQQ